MTERGRAHPRWTPADRLYVASSWSPSARGQLQDGDEVTVGPRRQLSDDGLGGLLGNR